MRDFHITRQIGAPIEKTWAVLADIDHWPEWTRSVSRVEALSDAPMGVGSRVRVHQPRLRPVVWEVRDWQPARRFVWQSGIPGLHIVADHLLEPSEHGCMAALHLRYDGPLGAVVGILGKRITTRYLAFEADGLKARSEGAI
ncbi:SRPBCC family protein [Pararobbsia silviterrae]|nr:SRPBCC family protein [Pararobbsia silviterrae]